jgi:hypothetical protein
LDWIGRSLWLARRGGDLGLLALGVDPLVA